MIRNAVEKVYRSVIDRLPDYAAINVMYFRRFRRLPNLRNPRTFNEKIAWRKLYQHNPLFPIFSDKVAVKAEIAKLIGEQHITETLWVGSNPHDFGIMWLAQLRLPRVGHAGPPLISPKGRSHNTQLDPGWRHCKQHTAQRGKS